MVIFQINVSLNWLSAKRNLGLKQAGIKLRNTTQTTQSLLTSELQSDFCMCSRARAISQANDDLPG